MPVKKSVSESIYFSPVVETRLYGNIDNPQFHLSYLFRDIDFDGKQMLDIGAGTGLFCLYPASQGAASVLCLEPDAGGSTAEVRSAFTKLATATKAANGWLSVDIFQEHDFDGDRFDVILLHKSINHLDEEACIELHRREDARKTYLEIFGKLSRVANFGTSLIIADCSRRNFFPDLGLTNPFARGIEWHKH
jgi:SAM-dependent methyltransferase